MTSSASPPPPEQVASDRRMLFVLWLANVLGGVVMVGVLAYLGHTAPDASLDDGALLFYLNAAFSVGAVAGAFAVQRGLEARLSQAGSYAAAAALIRQRVVVAAAIMEASALFAALAAFLTGEWINLAFVVPFFGFALLFFPGEGRYAYWLALWRGSR